MQLQPRVAEATTTSPGATGEQRTDPLETGLGRRLLDHSRFDAEHNCTMHWICRGFLENLSICVTAHRGALQCLTQLTQNCARADGLLPTAAASKLDRSACAHKLSALLRWLPHSSLPTMPIPTVPSPSPLFTSFRFFSRPTRHHNLFLHDFRCRFKNQMPSGSPRAQLFFSGPPFLLISKLRVYIACCRLLFVWATKNYENMAIVKCSLQNYSNQTEVLRFIWP